jgi:hypothetical protein
MPEPSQAARRGEQQQTQETDKRDNSLLQHENGRLQETQPDVTPTTAVACCTFALSASDKIAGQD